MRCVRWAIYAWPGLPELWQRGAWSGLLVAVAFGTLLNLILVSSLVWTEWLAGPVKLLMWATLGFAMVSSVVVALYGSRKGRPAAVAAAMDLFQAAQSEYLRGNWFESELALNRLIRQRPRDVDAHLMLATLLRHTRRFDEAAGQLDRLSLLAGAERWSLEIGRERQRLSELSQTATNNVVEIAEQGNVEVADSTQPSATEVLRAA